MQAILYAVRSQSLRRKRAQAIVETALLFPLLCLLMMGSVDFGRVFYYSVAITNAAREGARHGAYYDPTYNSSAGGNPWDSDGAVLSAIQNEVPAGSLSVNLAEPFPPTASHCLTGAPPYSAAYYPTQANSGYVYVCFNEADGNTTAPQGGTVRVTILYNFTPVTPIIQAVVGNGVHVQATSVMVVQGPN
jgi:hypothetical protein